MSNLTPHEQVPPAIMRVFVSSVWYDVKTLHGKAHGLISGDRAEMEWQKHLDELRSEIND